MLEAVAQSSVSLMAADRALSYSLADMVSVWADEPSSTDGAAGFVAIDALAQPGLTETLLAELVDLGLESGASAGRMVSGLLPVEAIEALNTVEALRFAMPVLTFSAQGSVTGQGDRSLGADLARQEFGVDGTGVTIGALSDSFNALLGGQGDIASGDLPEEGVLVVQDFFGSDASDEGRAMLQIIHDTAPGASLQFATAFGGQAVFANNIERLAQFGSDIIVDDVVYLAEPFFQDGIIAQAVDSVVADGVTYFSSAGNAGFSSYEAPFRSSGEILSSSPAGNGVAHDWNPGAGVDPVLDFTLAAGDSMFLSLQWDQPFASISTQSPGADTDLDIYLVDPGSLEPVRDEDGFIFGGLDFNIGADPVEIFRIENESNEAMDLGLVIENAGGPDPENLKIVFFDSTSFVNEKQPEYAMDFSNPTVIGHAAAEGAIAVGATAYFNTPAFGVNPPQINSFSSAGPSTIRLDIDGNRLDEPEIRQKPEITAPDGVDTTFFGFSDVDDTGFPNFFGTSAAAPHAAAVAALLLEADPSLSPDAILALLQQSAIDMGVPGIDNRTGAGLIQAGPAIEAALSGTNEPPVAEDDAFFVTENTPINRNLFASNGGLADSDPEGNTFTVATVNGSAANVGQTITLPSGAVLTVSANGQFTYDASIAFDALAPGQSAEDTFTYTTTDGLAFADSNVATATLTIVGVNDAPVAADDLYGIDSTSVLAANVINNSGGGVDRDPEGTALSVTAVNSIAASVGMTVMLSSGALLTMGSDGQFTYDTNGAFDDLAPGQSFTDSFAYTVSDGFLTATATASVVVSTGAAGIDAFNDVLSVPEDASATVDLVANDVDGAGQGLTVTAVNGSANAVGTAFTTPLGALVTVLADGTATVNAAGAFETLGAGDSVTETIAYTVTDGAGATDTADLTFTVVGANDAPDARDDSFTVVGSAPLTGNVLADNGAGADTDVDGDPLTVRLEADVLNGQVTLNATGEFTYTATAGFTGTDTFTYSLDDGQGGSDTAQVRIIVDPVIVENVPPIARADSFVLLEDTALSGNVLVDNGAGPDTDPDADDAALTVSAEDLPDNGSLSLSADGSFTYTPNENFFGSDSFTYVLRDEDGGTDTTIVDLTVTSVNDAPVGIFDVFNIDESFLLVGNLLADNGGGPDFDVDGDFIELVFVQTTNGDILLPGETVTTPSGALLSIEADGSFVYDQNGAFADLVQGLAELETFTYRIADAAGLLSAPTTLDIVVNGRNVEFSIAALSDTIREDADVALFEVIREGPIDQSASVDFAVVPGSAPSVSADDFPGGVLPSGTLTFEPGERTQIIELAVAPDSDPEADEELTVILSNPQNDTGDAVLIDDIASTLVLDDDITFTITGTAGSDKLRGTSGRDVIGGLGGNDNIKGRGGNDEIFGGDGNDKVRGNGGSDRIDGGAGTDELRGNGGGDVFVFAPTYGRDTIRDFGKGGNDRVDLSAFDNLTFQDFLAASEEVGRDLVFTAPTGDVLVFRKTDLDDIDAGDLIFG